MLSAKVGPSSTKNVIQTLHMTLTEPGIMSNAENAAGASCKGGIYSKV